MRHCVMFTWNDGVGDDVVEAVRAGLDRLAELDVVAAYRHGPDAGIADGNWDYAVVGDFATVDDYRVYAADPDHVALIGELIRPNIAARAAVQFHHDG